MDFLTAAGLLWKVVVAVPSLGVGIVIGALGYRYVLTKNPELLSKIVLLAQQELATMANKAMDKVAAVPDAPTIPRTATDTPVDNSDLRANLDKAIESAQASATQNRSPNT